MLWHGIIPLRSFVPFLVRFTNWLSTRAKILVIYFFLFFSRYQAK